MITEDVKDQERKGEPLFRTTGKEGTSLRGE